jgi:hypothetical protein
MKILKTTTAALISGLLMSGAGVPAWSATAVSQGSTATQASSTNTTAQLATSILGSPEFPRVDSRPDAVKNCKPGQIYSAHDVVGDPQACIMGGISLPSGATAISGVPAL